MKSSSMRAVLRTVVFRAAPVRGGCYITGVTANRSISTSVWFCKVASISGRLRSNKACENVLPSQVGKLRQQIFNRIAAGEILKNRFHWITEAAHAGLPVANLGVNRDA